MLTVDLLPSAKPGKLVITIEKFVTFDKQTKLIEKTNVDKSKMTHCNLLHIRNLCIKSLPCQRGSSTIKNKVKVSPQSKASFCKAEYQSSPYKILVVYIFAQLAPTILTALLSNFKGVLKTPNTKRKSVCVFFSPCACLVQFGEMLSTMQQAKFLGCFSYRALASSLLVHNKVSNTAKPNFVLLLL